jgi:hypothetical protein
MTISNITIWTLVQHAGPVIAGPLIAGPLIAGPWLCPASCGWWDAMIDTECL